MSLTHTHYLDYYRTLLIGAYNLSSVTLKVMCLKATHTPNLNSHDFVDDVSADEVSGAGYSAGGFTVTGSAAPVADASNGRYLLVRNDVVAAGCTFDWRYAVLYRDTGTPATSNLISLIDPGALQSLSAATFKIAWNVDGVLQAARA